MVCDTRVRFKGLALAIMDDVSGRRMGEAGDTYMHIYVIEDDESVREQLTVLLQRAGYEVTCACRFDRLVDDVLAASPDLVLLDLGLPGTDGQIVCRELRRVSHVPIVVVTSRATDLDEVMSMSLGADDFVTKPYNPSVLLAHIEACLRRVKGPNAHLASTLECAGVSLDLARCTASYEGKSVELTKNETRILSLLMRRAGRVVSREDIMVELWNSDAFIDDNTLTVNMNRLRKTLASIGVEDFLRTHRGLGYSAETSR